MNRQQLRERLRVLSGVLMDTLLTDAQANAFLDEANFTVCGLAEWSFLYAEENVATVGGQSSYALPGGIGRVQDVLHDQVSLQRRTLVDMGRFPAHRRTGTPWAWAPQGDDAVRVFPAPAAAVAGGLTVRGWVDVTGFADDLATPIFAEEFHPVIAYEAAAAVLDAEGDDADRSARYRAEVTAILERMARRYLADGGQVVYPPAAAGEADEAREVVG